MTLILNVDTVPPNLEAKSWGPPMPWDEVYLRCSSGGVDLTTEQFCKIVRDYLYVNDSRPHNEGAEFCGEIVPNVSLVNELMATENAIRPEASKLHQWLTTRVIVEGWSQHPHVLGLRRYNF